MKASSAIAGRAMLMGVLLQGWAAWAADPPLRELIDQQLTSISDQEPRRCTDAEYLRRVSLDLTGMPPTADEARAFLADASPDKRAQLVERLFARPQYARHMATTLDVMLMERRANKHVSADEWQAWLLGAVQQNKPWNELVREILKADGEDPTQRPAARFALDRECDPHALTRDIGRIFFGRDLQCAQCHDHPVVAGYLQSDYHGLLAFVANDYELVRKDGDKETTLRGEKAGSDLTFESVFEGIPRRTGPRMPGDTTIEEPFFLPGEEYDAAPADNVKAVPKFSRREQLATLATDGSNDTFNHTIANRLWAHMFGHGLVHPLDMHHPQNPATHPQLLVLLADRLAAMNFDICAFLREIALSKAYQRALDPPRELLSLAAHVQPQIAELADEHARMEEIADASADAYELALEAWKEAEEELLPAAGELDAARNEYAEAKKKLDEAVRAQDETAARLESKQQAATHLRDATAAAERAIQLLTEDTELSAATKKFSARLEQLTGEIEALTKELETKKAAVVPFSEALANLEPKVEAAHQKLAPFDQALRNREEEMLAARQEADSHQRVLVALARRLQTANKLAALSALDEAKIAAGRQVATRLSELSAAQASLAEYAPVIQRHETERQTALAQLAEASNSAKIARAELAARVEAAAAIAASVSSTLAAQQKLPGDAVLVEVTSKLQARAAAAQSETAQSQRQVEAADQSEQSAQAALAAAEETLSAARVEQHRRAEAMAIRESALAEAQDAAAAAESAFDTAVSELIDRWSRDFTVAALQPLTPEQLCWTILRVTGVYDRTWQAQVAELDKESPLSEEGQGDPAQLAARQVALEQKTFDALKGTLGTFVSFYGAAAGQPQGDFFATPDQVLFSANGGTINSWTAPAADNVTDRIIKQDDPRVAAEELYLAVLTRLPSEDETADVAAHLSQHSADKASAAQQLVWGLLNSVEFRFNH